MKRNELMHFVLWLYKTEDGKSEIPVCENLIDMYLKETGIELEPENDFATGGFIEGKTVVEHQRGEKGKPNYPHAWKITDK